MLFRSEVMNEIQYNTTSAGLVVNVSEFSNPANVEQFNQKIGRASCRERV